MPDPAVQPEPAAPAVQPEPAAPAVSVVVVNWNAGPALAEGLASLCRHAPSRPWEAIVVDNGSTDASLEMLGREHPWARVIANGRNRGLAAANNQGLVAARGTMVLISNPDLVHRPGSVDALCDLLDRRPRAAFAVPRLLHPDGTVQTSAGDLPTLAQALLGRQLGRWAGHRDRPDRGWWWDGWPHDVERRIGHGAEACYLVRRAAVAEIGLQDEGFRLDWEGLDWSDRAARRGWEVWLCPQAEVVHLGGASIAQARLRWVVASHAGMYRYFAKRRPRLGPVLAVVVAARALAKMALVVAGAAMYQRAHGQGGRRRSRRDRASGAPSGGSEAGPWEPSGLGNEGSRRPGGRA